jgi:hypothetical protein
VGDFLGSLTRVDLTRAHVHHQTLSPENKVQKVEVGSKVQVSRGKTSKKLVLQNSTDFIGWSKNKALVI